MRTLNALGLVGIIFTFSASAYAESEPAYCDVDNFRAQEIEIDSEGLSREHLYQLGAVKVLGLGILSSKTEVIKRHAMELGNAGEAEKYCTWYFNKGDDGAGEAFNHRYVGNPMWMSSDKAVREYMGKLSDIFAEDSVSILSCAERHGFFAMGCNSQRHRGPTVFGMMLAYSGCSAESSRKIVNKVWGGNFVRDKVRRKVMQAAHDLGLAQPDRSARLRELFSATRP